MKKQTKFDAEGYETGLRDLNGEPLPGDEARRLSTAEQRKLSIPSPDEVLETLRSKPRRGTPSRMEAALPARKALRLSQKDFARLIGATPATVRNWEQGRTPIPPMAHKFMRVVERHPEVLADLAERA